MKDTAEAVIIGGGIMGCSILYNMAVRGLTDSVLLERDSLGSGSTGKSQAICRMHYSNPVTARMAWESMKVYRDFEEVVGGPAGYVRTGYLVIAGAEDRAAMEANVAMQVEQGINTSVVTSEDVAEVAPMLDVGDAAGLAYEPESGYADPYSITTTYSTRAREMGCSVLTATAVTGVEVSHGRVVAVRTAGDRIETSMAVVAAGPWSRGLLLGMGVEAPLSTVRHQMIIIRRPQGVLDTHPAFGDLVQEFSSRPDATDITLVGVGEEDADLDTYNQGVDLSMVEDVFGKLERRVPAIAGGFFQGGWSGLFTITPDWHPVLDRVEGIDGLYCAVGFSGHGFKLSPMVGAAMAELILEGAARTIDITPLRLSRFAEGDLLSSRYRYNVLA